MDTSKLGNRVVLAWVPLLAWCVASLGCLHRGHQDSANGAPPLPASSDSAEPQTAPQPNATERDLAAKGMPETPSMRKELQTKIAAQTTAEVADDLGNMLDAQLNSLEWGANAIYGFDEIDNFRGLIQGNPRVLRLIEEGQQNPAEIVPLLTRELDQTLGDYAPAREQLLAELARPGAGGTLGMLSENDPYYQAHRKYKNPLMEIERVHVKAYGLLYVMANLRNFGDGTGVERWLNRPLIPKFSCREMDAWLAYQYSQSPSISPAKREALSAQRTGLNAAWNHKMKISAWKAPWSMHDMMFVAAHVDPTGLKTIDVLEIPQAGMATPQQIEAILAAFSPQPTQSM